MSEITDHEGPRASAENERVSAAVENAMAKRALAERDKAKAEEKKIEAEAKAAETISKAKVEEAKLEAAKAEAQAKVVEAEEKKIAAEIKRVEAEEKKINAEIRRANQNQRLVRDADKQVKEGKAGTDIRDFVRESLLDIMGAVDDAATVGKTRAYTEGLVGYIPSITGIGAASAENPSSGVVEFDLAVTVVNSDSAGRTGGVQLKVGAPPFVSVSGRLQYSSSHSTEREQTNRIRFSIPVTYARQSAPFEDE